MTKQTPLSPLAAIIAKRQVSLVFALSLLFLLPSCRQGASPSSFTAVNPLTYTDIPDSDIIRVGEDYYMVSTTMYYCPGAPIMHSRDLVHWRIVNYVYDLLEDDDIYNMKDGRNAYGKGQWATSLRYHDGLYYALFIANDQQKTYIYTTPDIQKGPWKRTVLDRPMHDASMLFDNGHLYVIYGNGELRLAELEPDGSAFKAGVEDKVIIDSPKEGWMLRAEGAHMYHIGDWYYVIEIDWPRGGVRTATAWRSHDIMGPYESKVVLQGAFDSRGDGVAQGPIIDTRYGDWYAIQFQDHGAVGRIPTIQPVTWVDGWPIMGDDTVPMKEVTVNLPESGEDYVWDNDEFDSTSLALVWQWNHKAPQRWSLSSERPGFLRLYSQGTAPSIDKALGTLTQRTVGPRSIAETALDPSGLAPGGEAGLCAFQSIEGRIGVVRKDDAKLYLTLHGKGFREEEKVIWEKPLESEGTVYLRIRYVFTPVEESDGPADRAYFSYSLDGENFEEVDYSLQMRFTLDYFTGYRSALYCFSTSDRGSHADFDFFHQKTY